jgi:hypothetical protein
MRSVSIAALSRAALVAGLVVVAVPVELHAQTIPTDPPEHRIAPPTGRTDSSTSTPAQLTTHHRIAPPTGVEEPSSLSTPSVQPPRGVAVQHRIAPPTGGAATREQSLHDMFMAWLRAQLLSPAG